MTTSHCGYVHPPDSATRICAFKYAVFMGEKYAFISGLEAAPRQLVIHCGETGRWTRQVLGLIQQVFFLMCNQARHVADAVDMWRAYRCPTRSNTCAGCFWSEPFSTQERARKSTEVHTCTTARAQRRARATVSHRPCSAASKKPGIFA